MDISSLTNAYSNYSGLASNAQLSQLSSSWQSLQANATNGTNGTNAASGAKSGVATGATDDELMDVCKQFESYLLEQVMKGMMDTAKVFSEDDSSANSNLVDFFKEQTLQQLCSDSTDTQSLGLAQMLYEQMKITYGAQTVTPATAEEASSIENVASTGENANNGATSETATNT